MSSNTSLIAGQIAVVIIEILVSSEGIRRSSLMENSTCTSSRSLGIVDIVACLACVDTTVVGRVHSMGTPAWCCITTA